MPLTRPLLTLPNTAFTQCGVKEKVTSISIYDTRRVEVLTKQGRKDLIQPHDLSWPQFSSIGDFVAYLKACHFQLRQFNNGEYKLISLVKGLGGGNGQSNSSKDRRIDSADTNYDNVNVDHTEAGELISTYINKLNDRLSLAEQQANLALARYQSTFGNPDGLFKTVETIATLMQSASPIIQTIAKTITQNLIQSPTISKAALEIVNNIQYIMKDEVLSTIKNLESWQRHATPKNTARLWAYIALALNEQLAKIVANNLDLTGSLTLAKPIIPDGGEQDFVKLGDSIHQLRNDLFKAKNLTEILAEIFLSKSSWLTLDEDVRELTKDPLDALEITEISKTLEPISISNPLDITQNANDNKAAPSTVSPVNSSWEGISSLIEPAVNSDTPAASTMAACLTNVVSLSTTEYSQAFTENENEETRVIRQQIAKLQQNIDAMQQKSAQQQADIDKLNSLTKYLTEKCFFNAEVEKFFGKNTAHPQVRAFYNSLLSHTSASFLALFLQQNSLELMKPKYGTILSKTKQGKNTPGNLLSGVETTASLAGSTLGFIPKIIEKASKFIPEATKFLTKVTASVPFINGALTVIEAGVKLGIKKHEKNTLSNVNDYMFGVTPKRIEKMAYYLAFIITQAYVRQIRLLTEEGAIKFGECGANRLVVGLLNGEMGKYKEVGIETAALVTLRLFGVNQNYNELFGIKIPWSHATLDAHQGLKVKEHALYQNCGVFYVDADSNVQQYINKDPKNEDSKKFDFMQVSQKEFEIFKATLITAISSENDEYQAGTESPPTVHTQSSISNISSSSTITLTIEEYNAMQRKLEAMQRRLDAVEKISTTMASYLLNKGQFETRIIGTKISAAESLYSPIKASPLQSVTSLQSIPTLGDGNCAFNAIAIGLCKLISLGELSNQHIQLLQTQLGLKDIIKWLAETPDWNTRQRILSPLLRTLAIDEIRTQSDMLSPLYKERLWEAYCVYHLQRDGKALLLTYPHIEIKFKQSNLTKDDLHAYWESNKPLQSDNPIQVRWQSTVSKERLWELYCAHHQVDDTFVVHTHISEKFEELNLTEVHLNTWWDNKGKGQYLDTLSQEATSAADKARWGSEIEIEFLTRLFGINIKYIKKGYSKTLGIGSGMISDDFTEAEKALLGHFNVIETRINCWTLRTCETYTEFEKKIANFAPLTLKQMEDLTRLLKKATQQQPHLRQFPKDSRYKELKEKLIQLGILIINEKTNEELFIAENTAGTLINEQAILNYAKGIDATLREKLLDCYRKNNIAFTIEHSDNHWKYIGS